jgi:hypothetical protein
VDDKASPVNFLERQVLMTSHSILYTYCTGLLGVKRMNFYHEADDVETQIRQPLNLSRATSPFLVDQNTTLT